MNLSVHCECGCAIPVTEVQAGAHVDCRCGRRNAVPLLSVLRREAGLESYKKSTAERIAEMTSAEELPRGQQCIRCGAYTPEAFDGIAECEQSWRHSSGALKVIWIPFIGFFWTQTERRLEELGRETNVRMKLRLCGDCRPRDHLVRAAWVLKWSKWGVAAAAIFMPGYRLAFLGGALIVWLVELGLQWFDRRILKNLFRHDAIYQELFSEFPDCVMVRGSNRRYRTDSSPETTAAI